MLRFNVEISVGGEVVHVGHNAPTSAGRAWFMRRLFFPSGGDPPLTDATARLGTFVVPKTTGADPGRIYFEGTPATDLNATQVEFLVGGNVVATETVDFRVPATTTVRIAWTPAVTLTGLPAERPALATADDRTYLDTEALAVPVRTLQTWTVRQDGVGGVEFSLGSTRRSSLPTGTLVRLRTGTGGRTTGPWVNPSPSRNQPPGSQNYNATFVPVGRPTSIFSPGAGLLGPEPGALGRWSWHGDFPTGTVRLDVVAATITDPSTLSESTVPPPWFAASRAGPYSQGTVSDDIRTVAGASFVVASQYFAFVIPSRQQPLHSARPGSSRFATWRATGSASSLFMNSFDPATAAGYTFAQDLSTGMVLGIMRGDAGVVPANLGQLRYRAGMQVTVRTSSTSVVKWANTGTTAAVAPTARISSGTSGGRSVQRANWAAVPRGVQYLFEVGDGTNWRWLYSGLQRYLEASA